MQMQGSVDLGKVFGSDDLAIRIKLHTYCLGDTLDQGECGCRCRR